MGVGDQLHAPATLSPKRDPVSKLHVAGWDRGGPCRRVRSISPAPGFDPPYRSACSYPGPFKIQCTRNNSFTVYKSQLCTQ